MCYGQVPVGEEVGETDDTVALEAFYRSVGPRLHGFLSAQYGQHVAEELTQETLARACSHWAMVRDLENPAAWAYRVAFNLASSRLRRLLAERRALARLAPELQEGQQGIEQDEVLAVRAAVRRLSRQQRAAVLLRYYADLSVAETAQVMGCREGTVKSHTRDALRTLRTRIGPQPKAAHHG